MPLEVFVRLVARALDSLPEEIVEKLSNVAVAVEDRPSPEVLAETGCTNPHDLFGLYRGIPRPWRSTFARYPTFPTRSRFIISPLFARACVHERFKNWCVGSSFTKWDTISA
mgnify:CR=1 FL=1